MTKKLCVVFSILFFVVSAASQNPPRERGDEQPIRISTQLVQLDVVVTDKNGGAVRGLTKNDFELYEGGKKQLITFFELVDAAIHASIGIGPGVVGDEHVPALGVDDHFDRHRVLSRRVEHHLDLLNTVVRPDIFEADAR